MSFKWSLVAESFRRPYPVTVPMVVLVSLVPLYVFIPGLWPARTPHVPEIALDRLVPLQPAWALVYGALYLFLIILPVLVVRQDALIRRTVAAYLFVWIAAYVGFVVYPTVAPRPEEVLGEGFAAWGLRFLYAADPPYNCFPSLHVAHSFVSALACYRVHRELGKGAVVGASLVAASTLVLEAALHSRRRHWNAPGRAGLRSFPALVSSPAGARDGPPHGTGARARRGHDRRPRVCVLLDRVPAEVQPVTSRPRWVQDRRGARACSPAALPSGKPK